MLLDQLLGVLNSVYVAHSGALMMLIIARNRIARSVGGGFLFVFNNTKEGPRAEGGSLTLTWERWMNRETFSFITLSIKLSDLNPRMCSLQDRMCSLQDRPPPSPPPLLSF
jgi:hypothetical protein